MHRLSSHFVLGYHGCDAETAAKLIVGDPFRPSDRDWDWLGPGVYFWEANPERGLDWACELAAAKRGVEAPAVVGAVIDLGLCLDMTTLGAVGIVRDAYDVLSADMAAAGRPLPTNGRSLMARRLDCAVIRQVHATLGPQGVTLDTVRGVFVEGDPIYSGAGFDAKTHVQICVCNPDCIKGVFRVREMPA